MDNRSESDKYREKARQELDERIKKFTEFLTASESDDSSPSKAGVISVSVAPQKDSAVHEGHRKRMRSSAEKDRVLESFSDIELLEFLLSFVIPRKDTNVTSHKLLDAYDDITKVLAAPLDELKAIPAMTENAVRAIVAMKNVCRVGRTFKIRLCSRRDVTELFGAVYAANVEFGMFVIYLDGSNTLNSVELVEFDMSSTARTIVQTAVRRGAKKVMTVWRDKNIIGEFGLSAFITELTNALSAVGVELLDFIMFIDYGYYTLCTPRRDYGGWYPKYLFIPERMFATSPIAFEKVHEIPDAHETSDEHEIPGLTDEVNMLVKRSRAQSAV